MNDGIFHYGCFIIECINKIFHDGKTFQKKNLDALKCFSLFFNHFSSENSSYYSEGYLKKSTPSIFHLFVSK